MKLGTKEHYDLMEAFERDHRGLRLDRESKDLWSKGRIYQNGEANSLFLAFRKGYSYCEAVNRDAFAAIETLSAQCAQLQAGEPVAWRGIGEDNVSDVTERRDIADQWERDGIPVTPLCASPQPVNPAQVTDAMVEAAMSAPPIPGRGPNVFDPDRMRAALTAAIGAGGQAAAQFLPTEDGEFNGNKTVASIVPEGCTGKVLVFDPGALHVNKDGSGYIIVGEDAWQLEDVRCEGVDGPEGSVHWITHIAASEMQALRDFLNGAALSSPHPADKRVVEVRRYIDRCRELSNGGEYTWWSRLAEILAASHMPVGDAEVALPLDEAAKICERLEHDASWDKCGHGYYRMKQALAAARAREDGL